MSKMRDAALDYGRQGLRVVPIVPKGKKALIKEWQHKATTDEQQIINWWHDWPYANIGLLVDGFIVIDIESAEGHDVDGWSMLTELEDAHGTIRNTYAVRTATGGGHLYCKFPDALRDRGIKKYPFGNKAGVEVKYKGYVVAPPSVVTLKDGGIGTYEVAKQRKYGDVPAGWIKCLIKEQPSREDWERVRPKGSGPLICEEYGISMHDVLTLPNNAKKVGDGFLFDHLIHGATGGGNMFVTPALNMWCCYRCDSGGDPLTWVAVREGFISCEDAQPGAIDKEAALRCKDVLRREGLINEEKEAAEVNAQNDAPQKVVQADIKPESAGVASTWFHGELTSVTIYKDGKPVIKQLPAITPVVIPDGPTTIQGLLEINHEHLYFEEPYSLTGPVCAFLCNFTHQEPFIVGIVSPSGSIKTEMIRAFGETQNQFCYPLSSITENTLISGLDRNIDTIPILRGRVLTIKDLTVLLSKKEDIRSAIFADFREFTDGYMHREFGNGVKKDYHDIHSSILFASTPAIERYYSMYSELGARMIFMRPQNDPIKAREKSRENAKKGMPSIRKTLRDAMLSFVNDCVKRLAVEKLPEIPDDIEAEIGELCDLLAWMRHPLHHDFKGYIDEVNPDPEFPTRIMNSIALLTQMHAFIHKRETVNREDDFEFARRIVADNIPVNRAKSLLYLSDVWRTSSVLSQDSGINRYPLSRTLDELTTLGLVNKISREDATEHGLDGRADHYRLAPSWSRQIRSLRSVIRLGGRIRERLGTQMKADTEEPIPQGANRTPQTLTDQAEIAKIVREVMIQWPAPGNGRSPTKDFFVGVVAATIRRRFPDLEGRNIEAEIKRLAESDSQIQAIIADRTQG